MTTTPTLTEALERIGLTKAHPSTRDMLGALAEAAGKLFSRDSIEINANADINAALAPFVKQGNINLLDKAKEQELRAAIRKQWQDIARQDAENLDAARRAVEAHVTATIARQRTIPTEATRVPKADTTAALLARLVDASERAEAAAFIRERDAADVVARYVSGDESDAREAAFLRHVEAASAGGYLRLNATGDGDAKFKLMATLRTKLHERQDARVGQDERDALELLPKVAADVARNRAEITGKPEAAFGVLAMAGQEGTTPNPRLVAQAARLAADAAAQGTPEARR
jgi:hypothetical protein